MLEYRVIYTETHGNVAENESIYIKYEGREGISKIGSLDRKRASPLNFVRTFFEQVFLPRGFPESVHPDYIPYQIWDTVQAFASTIMGTLTTKSIMQGVGVGESTATPLAAAVTWILKDGMGMLGRILFAWWKGSELDARCKRWRLFADVLNDVAMGIELSIPYFSIYSTYVLCVSTGMKAIVGVAGGATRAAVTQHQALQNNLADVSAKDGSQETFVNLIASCFGIFVLSYLPAQFFVHLFILLVAVHIYANYSAVSALRLDSLNEDRAALVIKHYYDDGGIVSDQERINQLESLVLFHDTTKNACGFKIRLGASFNSALQINESDKNIGQLLGRFRYRKFLPMINMKRKTINILLSKYARPDDIFEAFFHAFLYGLMITSKLNKSEDSVIKLQHDNIVAASDVNQVDNHKSLAESFENLTELRVPVQSILLMDKIISKEYSIFIQRVEKSGWILRQTLLYVENWRGIWE